MYKTITLSDGQVCRVRQLGLFELDGVGQEILGPYRYTVLLATGQVMEDEYDVRALTFTPEPPGKPAAEIVQGSTEWQQLREYETYLAALAHEKLRIESYEQYINDISAYILAHCVAEADRNRIVTGEDWDRVHLAALVPQLTEEGLAQCLRQTFQGQLWQVGDIGRADFVGAGQGKPGGAAVVGS